MIFPARSAPSFRSRIPRVLASTALPVALFLLGGCGPEEAAEPPEDENTEDSAEDEACTASVEEGGIVTCPDHDLEFRYGGGNVETEQVSLRIIDISQGEEGETEGVFLEEGESEEVLGRTITYETVNLDTTPSYVDLRVTWADED